MKTEFLKSFYKDLDKLTLQSVKISIAGVIDNVELANKASEIKNLKKLTGYKIAYRIKIGD